MGKKPLSLLPQLRSSKKCLLVAIATSDYTPQIRQLFTSAHLAGYWPGDYMILTPSISQEDSNWFTSRGIEVRTYPEQISDSEWEQYRCFPYYKKIVIERFHIFREEFKKWDVVVYMDCDIIVNGPIRALSRVRGFNATFDLVPLLKEQVWPDVSTNSSPFEHGYDPLTETFCSGVMAFETKKIITPSTHSDLLALARKFLPAAPYADQLILNLFFYKKWRVLPLAYDYLLTAMPREYLCRHSQALILHFTAKDVPWATFSPYFNLWSKNLQLSEKTNFKRPRPFPFWLRIFEFLRAHLFFSLWHFTIRISVRKKVFIRFISTLLWRT